MPRESWPVSAPTLTTRPLSLEPLAITGIGCRFPGARGPAAFWSLVRDGRSAITEVPDERWNLAPDAAQELTDRERAAMRWGGFLEDAHSFDWRALRIPRREARHIDPQQRVLLEVAWEALEDAGLPLEQVAGSPTGVFVGISWDDHARLRQHAPRDPYDLLGALPALAANRISFCFGLRGPSIALDAGCASSLSALHAACQSLRSGETTAALVCGVELMLASDTTYMMARNGLLSPSGRCAALSAEADGVVRGEGCGVLVLRRLADVAASDRVYAVVRGTALNHNGRNEWIMAASGEAQQEVLRDAYRRADVDPTTVDYVELHGASTLRGDPIEVTALGAVLRPGDTRVRPCAIGSVKSSVGHLGAAAGIAALTKVALSLHHGTIPGFHPVGAPNPAIELAALGLAALPERTPFPDLGRPPCAAVNSTSIGGCNAHAVLEAAAHGADERDDPGAPRLLPLSARSADALRALSREFIRFLAADDSVDAPSLRDICYTASVRRSHHDHRLAVIGRTRRELSAALAAHGCATPAVTTTGDDAEAPLRRLAAAYVAGEAIDFAALFRDGGRCVSLPLPAWQRERFDPRVAIQPAPTPVVASTLPAPSSAHRTASPQRLVEHLRAHVRAVLDLSPTHPLGDHDRLFDAGLDSFSAVELARRLAAEFARPVSPVAIFNHPTLAGLAEHLAGAPTATEPSTATPTDQADVTTAILSLPEQEIEARLLERLAALELDV